MPSSGLAPIALFAYRRPRHIAATLDALERCPEFSDSPVFVFSDGPRSDAVEPQVAAVRFLLKERQRANMTIIESTSNLGLANSIISGVSRLCAEFGNVIVIEDDLIVHQTALGWLNSCLDRYVAEKNVFAVGAYQYRIPEFANRSDGMLARFASSWGWATWSRAWAHFDPEATGWQALSDDPLLARSFDCNGVYPCVDMLKAQMSGQIDSWAIRWWWTVFREGGLSVFPPRSLVRNIGFDETATHNTIGALKRFTQGPPSLLWESLEPPAPPWPAATSPDDTRAFSRGLLRTNALRNHRIKNVLRAIAGRASPYQS